MRIAYIMSTVCMKGEKEKSGTSIKKNLIN